VNCKGLHCPGCGNGGGGAVVLLIAAVLIISAIARPAARAADAVGHAFLVALEVAAITVASIAGLAVLAGTGLLARHVMRRRAGARQAVVTTTPRTLRASRAVSARRARAIEQPGPALYVIRSEHRIEEKP
jgi:hypothetical protein